ncbi:MAG: DHA2 family efflux MFS transporter permease subunit [Dehalococcoidia bacterium]
MQRKYVIFSLVAMALLMSSIDSTIVAVGLPAMRESLGTSILLIGWTLTAYQLGTLLVMPLAGKLSDELGRKRVFLASIAIFTVASLLCGLAPNVQILILCRALQAVGGGAFLPSCTGIIADTFAEKRGQAIGLFSSIFPIGGVIGPNIGGVIIDTFSWRFIFYVNVPIGIAVLLLTWWIYRPAEQPFRRPTLDFAGVAIYGAAISALLVGLTWLGEHPSAGRSPLLWLAFAGVAALLVFWYRFERRAASPMIDTELLRYRPFLAANAYNFLFGAAVFGFTSFLPTYAELHYGLSATAAGLLLTPRAIVMVITSTFSALVLIRFGYRLPMILGVALVALSLLFTSFGAENVTILGVQLSNFAYLASIVALLGLGFGLSGPASNNAALDLFPSRVAAVTGIRGMFRLTGGTLGTAMTVFVASLFADEAQGLQVVFFAMVFVMLAAIPMVFLIPDTARERRQAPREEVPAAEPSGPRLAPSGD